MNWITRILCGVGLHKWGPWLHRITNKIDLPRKHIAAAIERECEWCGYLQVEVMSWRLAKGDVEIRAIKSEDWRE